MLHQFPTTQMIFFGLGRCFLPTSAPWITIDIRFKMNRRYKLFKKATSTKCPLLWQEYAKVSNEGTSDLRKAKPSHFSKMFEEVKKTSAYWNLIRNATHSRVHMMNIGLLKRSDGSLAVADDEKARLMNSRFALVGEKLANALPRCRKRECQNATYIFNALPHSRKERFHRSR